MLSYHFTGFAGSLNVNVHSKAVVDGPANLVGKSNSENDALYLHSALEHQLQMGDHTNR